MLHDLARPDPLERAILRTVVYGDLFDFPMTPHEIHRYLIAEQPSSWEQVHGTLAESEYLAGRLSRMNGYVALTGREALFDVREDREVHTRKLWEAARTYGRWLARMPFVRMVTLTGALAVRNPSGYDDDLDYLIVAAEGRVWLARAFAILVVRLGRLFGVEVCPNYVVTETALRQNRRGLYVAHEVLQAVPLYGYHLHEQLLAENGWVFGFLPNARMDWPESEEIQLGRFWAGARKIAELVLGGRLGDMLEHWEFGRKQRQFAAALQDPVAAAEVEPSQLKGHFNDHGVRVMHRYAERLQQMEIPES